MSANLTLAITAGVLVACGIYLLLERSLTRILIGVILTSNGINLLFLGYKYVKRTMGRS